MENAAEMGRKGQAASVEAQKRNRTTASFAKQIQNNDVIDDKEKEKLAELGITEEQLNGALVAMAVFNQAVIGNIPAVDKWEELLEKAAAEYAGALTEDTRRALALMRENYVPNISSNFGTISVAALKHLFTHYEAFGGRGSLKSSWASLTVVRLLMEHPDIHALVLRKVANTMRDSVYAQ